MRGRQAPYGTWISPVGSDAVARDIGWMRAHAMADGDAVYWLEARPLEGGREVVVVARPGSNPVEAVPAGANVRTRVHEYGGGAYTVFRGALYYCEDADQRVYGPDGPVTEAGARYADLQVTPDGQWLVCVRERGDVNDLVAVSLADGGVRVLASGHDFYSTPRVSPDGARIAWLAWDHPRMPWQGSLLYEGPLFGAAEVVAGSDTEAIVQPAWSPSGELYHCSDRSGWWNIYRGTEAITALEAEIGGAMWEFGSSWYTFLPDGRIVAIVSQDGLDSLLLVGGEPFALRLTRIVDVTSDGRRALFVGGAPTVAGGVYALDVDSGELAAVSAAEEVIDPAYVSVPRPVSFPSGGVTSHALFYPPVNPDFAAVAGERPPLIVRVHGGPTAHSTSRLREEIQFFTSRGFAVVDVNYGGSTGYGRNYRERLHGTWGVVDVDDCVAAARHLAEAGEVDGARMAITGGSSGGWTVLCALAFHPDVFACGADYYGVSSLEGFADDTHKFESHYIDWLVPRAQWRSRAPIDHVDRIRVPVIVLQGLEDPVVPPSQSEIVVAALREKGIPHRYITFAGEQHGFRRAENLRRAVEEELDFYSSIFVATDDSVRTPSS